jgi:hypothetical protein
MKRTLLDRRTFLRGAGGIALGLPLLEIMGCGRGGGGGAPRGQVRSGLGGGPKRFVVFWTPNGTIRDAWLPSGSETAFTLSPILAALAPYQQDIVVLDGIDAMAAYPGPGDAHQKGTGSSLTGIELQEGAFVGAMGLTAGWANGISIDQTIADVIGTTTKFRSLEFGVHVHGANVGSRISYRGPAQPVPPENDPSAAFARIFGDFSADPVVQDQIVARRRSVLDAVARDYERLAPRLGTADRQKLEAHLAAVRDIEMRLGTGAAPVGAACMRPELGAVPDPTQSVNIPTIGRLQMDLLAMSLACDMTRVASIMWTNSATMKTFPWLSISEGHHELAHRGDEDLDARDKLIRINTWYAEQFAYLVGKLKAIPEGDGSLLDNTLLIWVNEHSTGNTHERHDIPYVIAGKAGGAIRTGRFVTVPGELPHNDLWVSCQNIFGIESTVFGNPAYCTGAALGLA